MSMMQPPPMAQEQQPQQGQKQKEEKPTANPDPAAPENANLSTQQFIQRVAPQPSSINADRRDGLL